MNKKDILEIYNTTKSYAQTARVFGVSRQRIHQIVKKYNNYGVDARLKKYKKIGFFRKNCEICKKVPPKIAHHKDFNNKNDNSSNLQPVCLDCHLMLHTMYRDEIGYYKGKYHKCKRCGMEFKRGNPSYNNGYCQHCYRIINNPKENFLCAGCGKKVIGESNRQNRKFCNKCKELWVKKNRDPITVFKCDFCKKKYHPFRNWKSNKKTKNAKQHFCSMACYMKSGIPFGVRKITKKEAITSLVNFVKKNKKLPMLGTRSEPLKGIKYSVNVYYRIFGNWTNAKKEARLEELLKNYTLNTP